jgi:regulatory protein YycH of two-component signal transduction system YycFG
MKDFSVSISVSQPASKVFEAASNVRGWWSENIEGRTDELNAVFYYHYEDVHRCTVKIVEYFPNKRIVWEILDNYFNFTNDSREWTGNRIVFEVIAENDRTTIRFTQIGLIPSAECYDRCANEWKHYIGKSLFGLITKGMGHAEKKH